MRTIPGMCEGRFKEGSRDAAQRRVQTGSTVAAAAAAFDAVMGIFLLLSLSLLQ